MGTKNNPGRFDCYANAAPDEPMFVLLGRDRFAADLVYMWAYRRAKFHEDSEVLNEARECANAMDAYCRALDKVPIVSAVDVAVGKELSAADSFFRDANNNLLKSISERFIRQEQALRDAVALLNQQAEALNAADGGHRPHRYTMESWIKERNPK